MKKFILIFGLTLFSLTPKAQDMNNSMSNAEQFCKAQERTISSYLLYSACYGIWGPNLNVSVMKYVDTEKKDTTIGVTFSHSKRISNGDCGVYKELEIMIDYEEIGKIISWLESNQWIANCIDPKLKYLSYTPKKSNLLLKIQRQTGSEISKNLDFIIQFNKYDPDSRLYLSIDNLTSISSRLKKIQEAVGY